MAFINAGCRKMTSFVQKNQRLSAESSRGWIPFLIVIDLIFCLQRCNTIWVGWLQCIGAVSKGNCCLCWIAQHCQGKSERHWRKIAKLTYHYTNSDRRVLVRNLTSILIDWRKWWMLILVGKAFQNLNLRCDVDLFFGLCIQIPAQVANICL